MRADEPCAVARPSYSAVRVTRVIVILTLVILAVVAVPAASHGPASDGGPAGRGCGILPGGTSSFGPVGVEATRISCRIARWVATGSVRKTQRFQRWACIGRGTRFGHCHGVGVRKGAVVYWFAAH